jgi:gas vesicle protein
MTVDLNQPQIAAAIVGGLVAAVVSLIVAVINQHSLRSMHKEKLDFDREQAERKTTAEIDMAGRKLTADIELAEKKFALDQTLATWKRKRELAEQTLIHFYGARAALRAARLPLGGGETRPAKEGESDELKDLRNRYYAPVERLESDDHFLTLRTLRLSFKANFGSSAGEPFDAILRAQIEIVNAAATLIESADKSTNDSALLETLGLVTRQRPDGIEQRIDEAVRAIEAVCQPVLAWRPDA